MMVKVLIGDLFQSEAQTLVNTVNCVGVMGKGIALEFKKRFPDMFADYQQRCKAGEVQLGKPYLYRRLFPPWILNFPTKDHWRSVSRLADIERGLDYLEARYKEWEITSLAVPPLGCGHGQLDWRIVGPILYQRLSKLDIPVELYAPFSTPAEQLAPSFLGTPSQEVEAERLQQLHSPHQIGPAWLVIIEILKQIEEEPYHWPVGRTRFQKLTYFATESGLPTGLTFQKGSYGPFSSQLKKEITRLVNHRLIVEEKQGQMFTVHVGPAYEEARSLAEDDIQKWRALIDKVVDLLVRTDTKQAEIAAAVHFTSRHLVDKDAPREIDVYEAVRAWKIRRRPPLNDEDIAATVRELNVLSWLNIAFSQDLPVPAEAGT